jgi:hypothetical protein
VDESFDGTPAQRRPSLAIPFTMSFLLRRPGALIALGTSAVGGAVYRYSAPPSSSSASLNPHTFTPYTLLDKERVSQTSSIFTLRNRDGAADPKAVKETWKHGVWSIQIKQPQLQIARDYTPLPPTPDITSDDDEKLHDIRLLIRQEEGGEVSTYLHRLPEQSTIELRGPKVEWRLPDDIQEVIFLAGGTGIAPAMQVAQVLGRKAGTKMQILWANRRREECLGGVSDDGAYAQGHLSGSRSWKSIFGFGKPAAQAPVAQEEPLSIASTQDRGAIVRELESLKKRNTAHHSDFAVQYYVDEEKKFIKPQDVEKQLAATKQERNGSRVILISGPDGFIEYWAGKKLWIGGRETQGPLGGVLSGMDLKGWTVYKL